LLAQTEVGDITGSLGVIGNVSVRHFLGMGGTGNHQGGRDQGHRKRLFHCFAPLDH
jgi:hypothetical protein